MSALTIDHPVAEGGVALAANWMQPLATDCCLNIPTPSATAPASLARSIATKTVVGAAAHENEC